MTRGAETSIAIAIAALATIVASAQTPRLPRSVTDPGVVTTRQGITPAGVQTVFDGKVYGVTFGASADELWVLAQNQRGAAVYRVNWRENRVAGEWHFEGTAALQGLALDPGRGSPLVGLTQPAPRGGTRGGSVQLLRLADGKFAPLANNLGHFLAGSPATAGTGAAQRAIVPLVFDDALAVVNGA